jgi:hypothetical protein
LVAKNICVRRRLSAVKELAGGFPEAELAFSVDSGEKTNPYEIRNKRECSNGRDSK